MNEQNNNPNNLVNNGNGTIPNNNVTNLQNNQTAGVNNMNVNGGIPNPQIPNQNVNMNAAPMAPVSVEPINSVNANPEPMYQPLSEQKPTFGPTQNNMAIPPVPPVAPIPNPVGPNPNPAPMAESIPATTAPQPVSFVYGVQQGNQNNNGM